MKIKSKFQIITVLSIAIGLMIAFTLFINIQNMRAAIEEDDKVDQLTSGVFELNLLTNDYLSNRTERTQMQWQLRYDSLAELIHNMKFRIKEEQLLQKEILHNHDRLKVIFSRIIANYASRMNSSKMPAESSELEERLVEKLLTNSQTMVSSAEQLIEISHRELVSAQRKSSLIVILLVILITVIIAANSFFIRKSIIVPISKLQKGTQTIGEGDLNFKIASVAKDEIGDLSRAFDQMTEKLKTTMTSRDKLEEEIIERKQAEEELQKSEEQFRSVVQTARDAIIIIDNKGEIVSWNQGAETIFGFSAEDAVGKAFTMLISEKDKNDMRELIEKTLLLGKDYSCQNEKTSERLGIKTDGSEFPFEFTTSVWRSKNENSCTLIVRDISERKKAEAHLKLQSEQLIQADKMVALGTLVAGVTHEINNPNNFITINAPVLGKAWQSILPILEEYYADNGDFHVGGLPFTTMRERVPQLLAGITDGSKRIKTIVADLKRFAQPSMPAISEHVDVNSVVKSALVLVDNMIKKATHNFSVEYGSNIPSINGNFQHLEQVVINLVQNACQALPDRSKGVFISTSYDEKERSVLIKIRDEGVGIQEASLSQVMDPFFTTKRSSGGTGLGLSVSSTIIKEHFGQINVASEPGQGATFTVSLPTQKRQEVQRVLVVDDDDSVRKMLTKVIRKDYGCLVEEAFNGVEACIKLGTYRPDLLILDIMMPDMDGVEVCRMIKAEPELTGLKVVIITGFPDAREAQEIAGMGFTNLCPKPVELRTFRAMLDNVLNK